MPSGNFKARERILNLLQLHVAALRNVPGAVERVLHFAEQRHHLRARLHIKLRRAETHPVRIRHRLAGLDAEQNFVRAHIVVRQIMRIVRDNQRNAGIG